MQYCGPTWTHTAARVIAREGTSSICVRQKALNKRPSEEDGLRWRWPSRPGEFHPEPLTDPDLNLSIHPARVTARRLPPSSKPSGSSPFDPVGPLSTTITHPRRSM